MKYAWIKEHRDLFSINSMCHALQVSPSGYYRSLSAESSPRAQRTETIKAAVRQVHASSNGIYGSYKIAEELEKSDEMETACRNTVARAMREMGLNSKVSKQFKPTTTELKITAAFCMEVPIAQVRGTVDMSDDKKIANLNDMIRQLAFRLVPQEEPLRSYTSD
mgnify:CR=1 FL=1